MRLRKNLNMKDYCRLRWLEKALTKGSAWPGLWQARNMQKGREKTHTKGHCTDQYVATMLFRVYPLGVEFPEGLEQKDNMRKKKQDWFPNGLHRPEFSFVTQAWPVFIKIWHHIRLIFQIFWFSSPEPHPSILFLSLPGLLVICSAFLLDCGRATPSYFCCQYGQHNNTNASNGGVVSGAVLSCADAVVLAMSKPLVEVGMMPPLLPTESSSHLNSISLLCASWQQIYD